MTKKYVVNIYEPYSRRFVMKSLESDSPFLSFTRGDTLNHLMWKDTNLGAGTLVIKDVVHALWDLEETGEPKHRVSLFTEFIDLDKPEKANASVSEPVMNN